jgi:DNA-directed RNA polymerase subunit H (RpoH/RPB5)
MDDLPYIIYTNVFELIKFRDGGKILEKPNVDSVVQFNTYLANNDFRVIVTAERLKVILLFPNSKYSKSAGIRTMFNSLIDRRTIFLFEKISDFKGLVSTILKWRAEHQLPLIYTPQIFTAPHIIEMNVHNVLMFNMPKSETFVRYKLLKTAHEFFDTLECKPTHLPFVRVTDTHLFWHGFRHGEIVEEFINSPTAGDGVMMRLVVNSIPIKTARTAA